MTKMIQCISPVNGEVYAERPALTLAEAEAAAARAKAAQPAWAARPLSERIALVKAGVANWEYTEIESGLKAGDRIVLSVDREGVSEGVAVQPES